MQNWWRKNETTYIHVFIYNYSSEQDKHLQGHSLGPYVFQLIHERTPVELNDHLIRYKQFDHLTFLSNESGGLTLQDAIVTVSVPSIHAKNLLLRSNLREKLQNDSQNTLNDIGQFPYYQTTTVEELLLTGRRSNLMPIISGNNENVAKGLLPYCRKLVTNYSINSGKNESRFIASIESIDGQSLNLDEVRDGHQYNPGVRKTQSLMFLEPSLCMFGHLLYNSTKVKNENTIYDFTLRSFKSDQRWPASQLVTCENDLSIKYKIDPFSSHFEIEPVSNMNHSFFIST